MDAVRPKVAVASAGTGNPYGHPAPATLERLARALEVAFEAIAYVPPELTDDDVEFAAVALRWATEEWAREEKPESSCR